MSKSFNLLKQLSRLGWLRTASQVVFFALIGYFMIEYISGQWEQISDAPPDLNIPILLLALLGITLSMGIQPFGTWHIIRNLGEELSKAKVWQAFFIGQIAKYLPGSIWSLPSRGFLYNQRGVSPQRSVETVIWETGLAVVAATLVGILAAPLLIDSIYFPLIVLEIGGFSIVFIGTGIVLRRKQFSMWLGDKIPFTKPLLAIFPHLPASTVLPTLLIYVGQWLLMGMSFTGIALALGADLSLIEAIQVVGLFPGVWAVGLLIVITPGGIGIREALITIALSGLVNDPLPLYAAVIARMGWTLSEVINILLSSYMYRQEQRSSADPELSSTAGLMVEASSD